MGQTGSDEALDAMQVRFKAATDSVVRASASLDRGKHLGEGEGGFMVKATGAASTRGQVTERKGQPPAKNKKDRETLENLRCEVNEATPGELVVVVQESNRQ